MSDDKMKHGGKRKNAGRPATGVADTKVVRVDADLVPAVNEIKTLFKESGLVPNVTTIQDGDVTLNQDTELLDEVALLKLRLATAQANIARLEHENKHLLSGTRYKDIPPQGEPS